MSVELLNRFIRPGSTAGFALLGILFLAALGTIMLYRYAVHGELDWGGLTAFVIGVIFPVAQFSQHRHDLYQSGRIDAARPLAEPSLDGLVNPHAVA